MRVINVYRSTETGREKFWVESGTERFATSVDRAGALDTIGELLDGEETEIRVEESV